MPRLLASITISILALAAAPVYAQEDTDWSKIELRATKVSGTVHMIDMTEGSSGFAGGNIGVSSGADGVVMIDAMFAPLAPKIRAILKSLTDKPVRFVINSHVHGDHTGGNAAFGDTATIIAHINTRTQLSTDGTDPDEKAAPAG